MNMWRTDGRLAVEPADARHFVRQSGVCLIAGCALLIAGDVVRVLTGDSDVGSPSAVGWFVQALGAMLALIGLPGIYMLQTAGAKRFALLGVFGMSVFLFLFGVFGGLLHSLVVVNLPAGVSRPPSVGLSFLAGALGAFIGGIAFGIAAFRTHGLPRGAGILTVAGAIALLVGHPIGFNVEDAGLVLLMTGIGWSTMVTVSLSREI